MKNRNYSNVAVTADLHLGHGNILKHSHRTEFMTPEERGVLESGDTDAIRRLRISPESVARMDTAYIDSINQHAGKDDLLIVVGDFCMIHRDENKDRVYQRYANYRERIVCKNVILVWGNHDPKVDDWSLRSQVSRLFTKTYGQLPRP